MPIPKLIRHALKTGDNTKWYYVDGNNQVKESSFPVYLEDEEGELVLPLEWRNLMIGLSRNETYGGLFGNYTLPMSFTYKASIILKYINSRDGHDGEVIYVADMRNNDYTYTEIIKAQVDFSQLEGLDEVDSFYYKVPLAKQGLEELLKTNESITQEIPFDADAITILHDGIKLDLRYLWVNGDPNTPPNYQSTKNQQSFPDLVNAQIDDNNFLSKLVFAKYQFSHTNDAERNSLFLETQLRILATVTLEYDIRYAAGANVTDNVHLDLYLREYLFQPNGVYAAVNATIFSDTGSVAANQSRRVSGSVTVPVIFSAQRSYKLGVAITNGTSNPSGQNTGYDVFNLRLSVTGVTRMEPTNVKAFLYPVLVSKLFKKALGSTVDVRSDYLNTYGNLINNFDLEPKFTAVTSGLALRNLPNPVIKTSIKELRQDIERMGLGIGIEGNTVRIEPLSYFFDADTILETLDTVTSVKRSTAVEYLANQIKAGSPSQQYDNLNGLEDFFGTSEWLFPTKRIQGSMDWVTPYHCSPWAQEYARSFAVAKKDSTDSQYDNQTYLTQVNSVPQDGKYILLRRPGATTGISHADTMYNWGLSPATTLYLNSQRLLSMGYGKTVRDNGRLTFQTNEKNSKAGRDLDSYSIIENDFVRLQRLQVAPDGSTPVKPLYYPVILDIKATISRELYDRLIKPDRTRYGVLNFVHPFSGEIFGIFILDIGFYPETEDQYVIRGLCSPKNDLTKL